MKIPLSVACVLLSAILAVEAWTLQAVVDLKQGQAALAQEVHDLAKK